MGQLISLRIKNFNKFDYLIVLIIASLAYGEYEALGAFTPIRLIGVCSVPFIIINIRLILKSKFSKWVKFFFFWWTYMTISILWTPDKTLGIIYWFHFTCIISSIISLFLSTIKANFPLKACAIGWLAFVLLTIPIALWEITSGAHLSSGSFNAGSIIGREYRKFAAVTFANYNSYSLLLTYSIPFLLLLTWNRCIENRFLFRIVSLFTFLLVSSIILINSSRASFACLFFAIALFICFTIRYLHVYLRALLFIFVFFLLYVIIENIDQITVFSQLLQRLDGYESFGDSNRTGLIRVGLKISADCLYLGGGIMSMISLFSLYHADYNYAHNLIIELLVEYGAVISIWFIFLMALSIGKLYRNKITSHRFLFFYVLLSLPFMIVVDDYYFVRSGFWIYLGTIVSISESWKANKYI